MFHKGLLYMLFVCISITYANAQQKISLLSPDKSIEVIISVSDSVRYSVKVDKNEIVGNSIISFNTNNLKSNNWKISDDKKSSVNETLSPIIHQKSKFIANIYNQLHLTFTNGLVLEWRVYNNGIAWRWITNFKGDYLVNEEKAIVNLDKNAKSWFPEEDGFFSHNERLYKNYLLSDITSKKLASLPVLFENKNVKLLLTESGLRNYAGMWVRGDGNGDGIIQGVFPHYPKTKKFEGDRSEEVVTREAFIAKINGPQQFPWRILMVARHDEELISNQLVYQLSIPSTGDFSWVKPGKVQWDWWNDNNITGVDFRAGMNTDTYKYYTDFASKYGIEYVLIDEGWSDTRDLFKLNPDVNIEELTAYAKTKNVDILLWTTWNGIDSKMEAAMDQFVKWGVKGIKVDFMQRDDQEMVNFYDRCSREAAKRKLLVDFHGAYKPTGWIRTYPNVLTSEGVFGNEQSKGDTDGKINPNHNLNLPFIRMAAGPMDYTPGAMLNGTKDGFRANWSEPMSNGTRCHQLAMYVVFESLLQMLCDNPTHYYKEPECMEFLKTVPVEWDSTVVFPSKVGQYVAIARKAKNNMWFLGAMTNWNEKEIKVNLSFLENGKYVMHVWKDGVNADRNAKDFKCETITVEKNSPVTIKMAKGGGWVASFEKLK